MSIISSPNLLRMALWADAVISLASGALQVAATGPMSEWLGLPTSLLAYTGEFFLLYGAAVAFLATRKQPPPALIWLLVIGNACWAAATLALLMVGGLSPTLLGKGYVVMQAVVVAILAELQYFGLRRTQVAW
jgi:hypothetical protein